MKMIATLTARCCRMLIAAPLMTLLMATLLTACERRDIIEPSNAHYLRVYIQDSVKNVTTGFYDPTRVHPSFSHPNIMRVVLYDNVTGRIVTERFLRGTGQDEKGYYVDGYVICDPGYYKMMVYNSATETVVIHNEQQISTALATTNPLSVNYSGYQYFRGDEAPVLYNAPELLFVACEENLYIPHKSYVDTLNNYVDHQLMADVIVDSYYLQIRIRGVQYVDQISAAIDGLGSAKMLESSSLLEPEAAIVFGMDMAEVKDSTAVLYAVFNTFGKLPNISSIISISFNVVVVGGESLGTRINITEDFEKYDAVHNRWIILDKELVVPKPSSMQGGGFTPSVEEWKEVRSDIVI